jgi:type I restriction enzyme, S subunit
MAETANSKVPKIRFKGFVGEWEKKTLGEIGHVAMNKRIFKHETSEVGEIPFFKIGSFGGTPDAFISRSLFEVYKKRYPYPRRGDLLISAAGSIGKIVEYKGLDEYFQDSNIVWLKHENQIANSFLKQFYLFVKWSGLEGSTIKRLYNKNILETKITLPTSTEQTQIGRYFRELDRLIGLQQRKHDKLVTLKKAMLQKMFPQPGTPTPEIRFKGFEGDWVEKKVGEISGETYGGGTPRTSEQAFWVGVIPWIQSSDITGGDIYKVEPRKYISDLALRISPTKLVPANSIAIVTRVGVGKLALIEFSYAASQDFLSLSKMKIDQAFGVVALSILLHSKLHETQGTSIKGITKEELLAYTLGVPKDAAEQQKIGHYFRTLDSLISKHAVQLAKLKQLKSACLERMFVSSHHRRHKSHEQRPANPGCLAAAQSCTSLDSVVDQ